jgi:hypothetical protein
MTVSIDPFIDKLPEIDDILDLRVPATFVLVKPYIINKDVVTDAGIYIPDASILNSYNKKTSNPAPEIPESSVLSKGVVVTVGQNCSEIKAGMEVFFYKGQGHTKGAFTSRNAERVKEVYQLYQEYDIHAYLQK